MCNTFHRLLRLSNQKLNTVGEGEIGPFRLFIVGIKNGGTSPEKKDQKVMLMDRE